MAEVKLDYSGNSHKARQECGIEECSTQPAVHIQESSPAKRMLRDFIRDDLADIKETIVHEYILPGIQDCLVNIIDMIFGGSGNRSSSGSRRSYDKYYDRKSSSKNRDRDRENRRDDREDKYERNRFSYSDVTFVTKRQAEAVRRRMLQYMDEYESVSISDFYDAIAEELDYRIPDRYRTYTDNNFGWYDLGSMRIEPYRREYIIVLPKPISITD